jgi:hypothetical protein
VDKHARGSACNAFGGSSNADGVELPAALRRGYVGPVFLPGTGREVWWTGRVAIGLRYTRAVHTMQTTRGETWLQGLLLRAREALQAA